MKAFRHHIWLLFFFGFIITNGQTSKIDSLKLQLGKHQNKDTIRVRLLNDIAIEYSSINLEKSIEFLDQSATLSKHLNYKKGIAKSTFLKGSIEMAGRNFDNAILQFKNAAFSYEEIDLKPEMAECYAQMGFASYYKRAYNKSIEYFNRSIEINDSINNEENNAINLKYIGYAYDDLNNFDNALLHYKKALEINKKYNNKKEIASCLNNIGILYGAQTSLRQVSLEYYNESLLVSEEIKDSLGMLKALNNLGTFYSENKNNEKALLTFERSLVIQKNTGNTSFRGMTLNNLGGIYREQREFDKALTYLNESVQKSQEINDRYTESATLNIIGEVYRELKKFALAAQHFNESIAIKMEMGNEYGLIPSYMGLANVLADQKKYDEALNVTAKASAIAKKYNVEVLSFKKNVYELHSRIYKSAGDYKKALESHEKYLVYKDSLFNKEKVEEIAQIEAEYKYKQQLDSASIRELKLNKTIVDTSESLAKTQRNYLWAIIGALLLAIASGAIIFYQKYKNIKTKNQNIITEQRLLRSQMTPHFIFNSLSVLQGMILNKEEKKSVSYLSKFSKLLRIILENSRDKTVLLSQELEAVNNYLSLHTIENTACDFTLTVSDHIQTDSFKIPPMLIQPFIENAIEHAFPITQDHMEINVNVRMDNETLQCVITDNGVGVESTMGETAFAKSEKNKSKSSLATTITEERLQILSKDFNVKGSLIVEDLKKYNQKGTQVTLTIPYKTVAA